MLGVTVPRLLVITAAVLFYVALTDLKHFKILNEVILVLTGLFVVHAILSGRWVSAHWNLAFAALMFCAEWVAHESRLGPHPPWPEQDPPYHANPSETPPTFAAARARLAAMNNEADAQRFDVMCLGNGALSDQRMRHYMLQIQDDASLALESTP